VVVNFTGILAEFEKETINQYPVL